MTALAELLPILLAVFGIVAIFRLYRMATDRRTRLRDSEGREMDASELESDEPEELR